MARRVLDGGGAMDVDGVCYATLARLQKEMEVLKNGQEGAFAMISQLGSDASPLQHIHIKAMCRRLERLEEHAQRTGVSPLP